MRRCFAILSLRAGISPLHLQALLGHAGLEMVRHYAQMVDDDLLKPISKPPRSIIWGGCIGGIMFGMDETVKPLTAIGAILTGIAGVLVLVWYVTKFIIEM